ncbi:2OG-Fe(II) oxygenase [Nitrincola alkalilacustris]|uniref:2OG-Fe(II) oxygenase n=1 Tax=Nitrincola alkalilacustris TaxID=1571224 RepID=UPI00124CAFCD|nr:2OG-Fe(II) oxygenase [Nitrincola alkalilacustris]
MNTLRQPEPTTQLFDQIADQLVERGYFLAEKALPASLCLALQQRLQSLNEEEFKRAGIGREQDHQLNKRVRTDQIRWLTRQNPAEAEYLEQMEALRQGINRRLFMGLFDAEFHFAHYPEGAFYKRHLDAFRGNTNRVLSVVFYLNDDWQTDQGGEMLLYAAEQTPGEETPLLQRVLPESGTLAIFLSDEFPHEVLPTRRDRYSIAGWFRVNNTLGDQLDPPR